MAKKRLLKDCTLSSRTNFKQANICASLDCLTTTHLQYREGFIINIKARQEWTMSEETVCPSWTEQYTLKKTEASTPTYTQRYTQYFNSHHTLEHKLNPKPSCWDLNTESEGKEKEQKHIRREPMATQTGPLSEPLKDPEQTEKKSRENIVIL